MSYIDTRDLAAELAALEAREHDPLADDPLDEDERERLEALTELADEIGSEFVHGETMIPETDFEDYARELAEDIGAIGSDLQWPAYCIDWERAARELAMDYTSVEWEGVSYYVRAS